MALAGSEKSKTMFFFITSQILLVLTLYSLFDEAVVRRPWKRFQNEFNRLEMNVAVKELNKVRSEFKSQGTSKKLKSLELKLEEAIIAKESKEYIDAKDKLDELAITYDDLVLDVKFNKSIFDAIYYEWKHAYQTGHDYEEAKKNYYEIDKKIKEGNEKLVAMEAKLFSLKTKLNSYDNRISELEEEITKTNKPLITAEEKIQNINLRTNDIAQIVVEDYGIQGNIYWGRVDRCQTCHVASNKPGFEDVTKTFGLSVVKDEAARKKLLDKKPEKRDFVITEKQKEHFQIMYGTHPRYKELLGTHPVSDFGCTTCHGGEGRAIQIKGLDYGEGLDHDNSKSGFVAGVFGHRDYAHSTHHHGIEPLLRGEQSEANCLSCHNGQIYIPEAETLTKGVNLFVDLGCNGCHLVKGYEDLYKVGPELNKVAHKVDKTWLVDWIKNPKNYMPNSRMPVFGFSDEDAVAVASFLTSNSANSTHSYKNNLVLSGDSKEGKKVFDEVGCLGCHDADDSEKTYAERSRAPNLSRLSSKVVSASWVFDWIKNPKNYSKHARMPSLRLTNKEAADITAYLMSLNKDYKNEISNRSSKLAALVNGTDEELVKRGKKIVSDRGCYACHSIECFAKFDRIGPELTCE